jgi:hypothetical protein
MFWIGIGVAAILAVYVAQRELSAPFGLEAPASGRTPSTLTERGNVEPSPVVTRVEEPSWTTVEPQLDALQAPAAAMGAPKRLAHGAPRAAPRWRKVRARIRIDAPVPPAEYDARRSRGNGVAGAAGGGKAAAPAQPVDGAQMLASAMQKCGSEGLFSKFICEQKAFLQYCEDKWDKDPKCMRKVGER